MIPVSILRLIPLRDTSPMAGTRIVLEDDFSKHLELSKIRCTEMSTGFSRNQTWRIDSDIASMSQRLVLRRWNKDSYSYPRLSAILAFQAYLCKKQIAAPKPIAWIKNDLVIDSESFLWSLESYLPGASVSAQESISDDLLYQLASLLSTLHSVCSGYPAVENLATNSGDYHRKSTTNESQGLIERITKITYWQSKLKDYNVVKILDDSSSRFSLINCEHENIPSREKDLVQAGICLAVDCIASEGNRWIQQMQLLQDSKPPQHWILRDLWRENILVVDNRITGIVDFGASRVDWPMFDLVRCFSSFLSPHDKRISDALRAYKSNLPYAKSLIFDSNDYFFQTFQLLDKVATTLSILYWCEHEFDAAETGKLGKRWLRLEELSARLLSFESR